MFDCVKHSNKRFANVNASLVGRCLLRGLFLAASAKQECVQTSWTPIVWVMLGSYFPVGRAKTNTAPHRKIFFCKAHIY